MKAFFWGNTYLSPIQQGIQSSHVIAEMAAQARSDEKTDTVQSVTRSDLFWKWVEEHKTIILYRGGNQEQLLRMSDVMHRTRYPTYTFREDKASLNDAVTCVGIILPDAFSHISAQSKIEHTPPRKLLEGYNNDVYEYFANPDDTELSQYTFDKNDQIIIKMLTISSLAS